MSNERVLILRTNDANGRAYGGFQWPQEIGAIVRPKRWNPEPVCGEGLHGALEGQGSGSLFRMAEDSQWMVFSAIKTDVVSLYGKVKVPEARVEFFGSRKEATDWMVARFPNHAIIGASVVLGDNDRASTGDYGVSITGIKGTSLSGAHGRSISGEQGRSVSGYYGHSEVGSQGYAEAGVAGYAVAGIRGYAEAGTFGTAIVASGGHARAGNAGTVAAGLGGRLDLEAWVGSKRLVLKAIVGENGIEPDVRYVAKDGRFVKAVLSGV